MSEENPWKKLDSRLIYKDAWITVRSDQVICPDGSRGTYSVVETRLAIGVIALTQDQQVQLVGQFRYPINQYSWEIIEGGGEHGESALETAKRELQEEAGLIANDWEQLGGAIHLNNCSTTETGYIFLAQDLTQVEAMPDSTEILQLKTLPIREILRLIDAGEISDALTVIGIMNLARKLKI